MFTTVLILAVGMVQQDWYTFAPEGKTFRVELPSQPTSTANLPVTNSAGGSQLTAAYLKASNATYLVQVTESRGKVDPKTLDDGIRQFAADHKGTLGTLKPITVDGNPGCDFEMTAPSGAAQARSKRRWVVSGNSPFMLAAVGKPGAEVPGNADRFLGSLSIRGVVKVTGGALAKADGAVVLSAAVKADDAGEAMVKGDDASEVTIDGSDAGDAKSGPASGSQDDAAARKPGSTRFTISRIPRNAKSYPAGDMEDLSRSFIERERDGFRDVGPAGSILVGVRVSFIVRFGGPKVCSTQPVFRSGKTHYLGQVHGVVAGPVATIVAKPGYAVGGLVTHAGLMVDGFGMIFMKVDGDRLNPSDTYNSPWIGDRKGGNPTQVVSQGGLAVGLQGRSGKELNALGLTALK